MSRVIFSLIVLLLLSARPALAITLDEIPRDVRDKLPEFVLRMLDPRALAALSVADLREYAKAYEAGELRFVAEITVRRHSGPVTPELAALILQVPRGAPYIEERFVRLAKAAYGRNIFSSLEWAVSENSDRSVNLELWYSSGDPQVWIPEPSYSAVGGILAGVRYSDFFYGGQDRQLSASLGTAEEAPEDLTSHVSWTDNTLKGGRHSYSVSASVLNDWRRRRNVDSAADLRHRTSRLDLGYSRRDAELTDLPGDSVSLGAGLYRTDLEVFAGDPFGEGGAPRSDLPQSGDGAYVSVGWAAGRRDMTFTPTDGFSYSTRLEQHLGDFGFTRLTADLRRYRPMRNVFGHQISPIAQHGARNDIRKQFPAASLAVQAQLSLADGDVPFSQEEVMGESAIARGFPHDNYQGLALAAVRAEYRCALDGERKNEAFVFTDHALLGESFADAEGFNSYGVGGLFRLPFYGGFKVGAYFGWAYDGGDSGYGLSFGYQF